MAEQKSPLTTEPTSGALSKLQSFWAAYSKP